MKRKAWVVVLFVLALTALSIGCTVSLPVQTPASVACLDGGCR